MNIELRHLVYACCLLFVVSCGDRHEAGAGASVIEGALQCPDDYVAYDFGKSPIDLNTEYYQAALGLDPAVPYHLPTGIRVKKAECWIARSAGPNYRYDMKVFREKTDASVGAQHLKGAQQKCDGQGQCTIDEGVWCNYSYSCEYDPNQLVESGGPDADGMWTGKVRTTSTYNNTLRSNYYQTYPSTFLDCLSTPDQALRARRMARAAAVACVPKNCRGKTHRSANLDCKADAAMPVFSMSKMQVTGPSALTTEYNPEVGAQNNRVQTLYPNAPYRTWATVDFGQTAPKAARLLYWLSDVYVPKSTDVPAGADLDTVVAKAEVKEAFRCTVFSLDMSRPLDDDSAKKVTNHTSEEISPECFSEGRIVDNLASLTGLKTPLDSYKYLGTRLNRTLDIIGNNVFVPGSSTSDAEVNKVCAPNPPEFYFDTTSKTYDMVSYYRQRQVDSLFVADDKPNQFTGTVVGTTSTASKTTSPVNYDFGGKGTWVSVSPLPAALRIGQQEVRVGEVEFSVTNSRSANPQFPVDVSWFLAHSNAKHPFDPSNLTRSSGGFEPAMRASVSFYLWPTNGSTATTDMPLLGTMALDPKGANPDGKTESSTIEMPTPVRKMFFNSASPMHIPINTTRSFEMVACIDATISEGLASPKIGTDSRFFSSNQKLAIDQQLAGGNFTQLYKRNSDGSLKRVDFDWGNYKVGIGTGYPETPFTPWKGWGPGQGCRVASTPILITALSLQYPVPPISNDAGDEEDSNDTGTGSGDMSASQGTDSETVCQDEARQNCREAGSSNMESSGEMGRSFYNSDSSLGRSQGNSVKVDSNSELLGMQLVDMADPSGDEDSTGWPSDLSPSKQASTPVVLTISPPWDDIVKSLRKGKGKSPVDWSTGRYAGLMGLGMGIGFKVRLQIGPIPGLVTITISGGLATELQTELQFAPSEDDAYFCTGDADCVGVETKPLSFAAASQACAKKGGRLGELGTTAEANSVVASGKSGQGKYWLGGQQDYAYPDPLCSFAWNKDLCLPTSISSYRWLSNDAEFAGSKGEAAATYKSSKFSGTSARAFTTTLPTASALLYDGATDSVSLAAQSEAHPYICRYSAVNEYDFLRWSIATNLGVAAGIGISFCVPSDDPGICLGGSLNIVAVALSLKYEHKYYWLKNGSNKVYAMAGFGSFTIPWSVTLLEGTMWAQINAWIFSLQWNILQFDGFKIADGKLADEQHQFRLTY